MRFLTIKLVFVFLILNIFPAADREIHPKSKTAGEIGVFDWVLTIEQTCLLFCYLVKVLSNSLTPFLGECHHLFVHSSSCYMKPDRLIFDYSKMAGRAIRPSETERLPCSPLLTPRTSQLRPAG